VQGILLRRGYNIGLSKKPTTGAATRAEAMASLSDHGRR